VNGLRIGPNQLLVETARGKRASLTLTNYPIQGPIVSGPHLQPFVCETATWRLPGGQMLGPPLDADCSIAPRVNYLYMSSRTGKFASLESTGILPADVAKTTTTTGATVNFIVRLTTATVNRGVYQSATLHDPTMEAEPSPFHRPKGWNGALIGVQSSSCPGGWYRQKIALP
jgi:hypothetical protein